jgi:hypothetical protein
VESKVRSALVQHAGFLLRTSIRRSAGSAVAMTSFSAFARRRCRALERFQKSCKIGWKAGPCNWRCGALLLDRRMIAFECCNSSNSDGNCELERHTVDPTPGCKRVNASCAILISPLTLAHPVCREPDSLAVSRPSQLLISLHHNPCN